jgi:glycosyltransferase involved in cell wall biosynthesis
LQADIKLLLSLLSTNLIEVDEIAKQYIHSGNGNCLREDHLTFFFRNGSISFPSYFDQSNLSPEAKKQIEISQKKVALSLPCKERHNIMGREHAEWDTDGNKKTIWDLKGTGTEDTLTGFDKKLTYGVALDPIEGAKDIEKVIKGHECHLKKRGPKAAMCAIVFNDAFSLNEWILHHLLIGMKHVYLFDDCSTDNIHEVLAPYIRAGYVTILHHNEEYFGERQAYAYKWCHDHIGRQYDYIAYIDLDEYINPLKDACIQPVLAYMDNFKAGGIFMHRADFGNEGDILQPHHCKLRTEMLGFTNGGFGSISKVICHTRRSNGMAWNMPHCCAAKFPKFGGRNLLMYPSTPKPEVINRKQCFAVPKHHEGNWEQMRAFVEHRRKISLQDVISKKNREIAGGFHNAVLSSEDHFNFHKHSLEFYREYCFSTWPKLPNAAALNRLKRTMLIRALLKHKTSNLELCEDIAKRTKSILESYMKEPE